MLAPSPLITTHIILARLCEQERAVADLIAGRSSLLDAAARFRVAGNTQPEVDEAACRAVIGWAHLALRDRPERADRIAGRLEQELLRSLNQIGRLPVPA